LISIRDIGKRQIAQGWAKVYVYANNPVKRVRKCRLPELLDPEVVIDLSRNVFHPDVYRGYDGVRR
jgi:hypothetical protein